MAGNHSQPAARDEVLFGAWRQGLDEQARAELIERYLPLARKLAARYSRSKEPFDDLVQVACVGLIKAVERYDPGQGTPFTAFAVPTILGELKRHFRDTCWTLRVDRRAQERARAVIAAQQALSAGGRAPTAIEIAQHTGFELDEVLEGLQTALAYSAVSLDGPTTAATDGEGTGSVNLGDTVGGTDERLELADDRAALGAAARHLPKLERQVLFLRYGEDLSQREIAERVGISQMHVSRLLRRALHRLREELSDELLGGGTPQVAPGVARAAAAVAGNSPTAA